MVVQHVAQGAREVVKSGPAFYCQGLVPDDLDALDMLAISQGLENPIGKAQAEEVLHGLFAEKVIHAKNRLLGKSPV